MRGAAQRASRAAHDLSDRLAAWRGRLSGAVRPSAAALGALALAASAAALDPAKALTQYTRSTWNDELPQNTVRAVLQSRDGYLWFGTYEGLARFDGVGFTVFDRSFTGGTAIYHLLEAEDGDLWVSTNGGLTRLSGGVFSTFTTDHGLPSDLVYATLVDGAGVLWVGTDRGLACLRQGSFQEIGGPSGRPLDEARALAADAEGNVWVASESGLYRFRSGEVSHWGAEDGLPDTRCWALATTRDGALWIGTDGGLARYHQGRFSVLTPRQGDLPDPFVRAICEDRHGNLWVGTEDSGLSRIARGQVSTLGEAQGLTQNHVRAIFEDAEGSLWVGTNGGLVQLSDGKVTTYTTEEGLSHDFARAVLEDRQGALWIGTDGGGLNRFANGRFTSFAVGDGLSSNSVRSLHQARNGDLWIGTRDGLDRYDGRSFTRYSTAQGLSSNLIRATLEDRHGDIWIATENSGLNRLRNGQVEVFTTAHGLPSNRPRALYEDRHGDLWIGTYAGACRLRDGTFSTYTTADGLANDIVFAFHEDASGNLWIGTDGGLSLLRDGSFHSFDVAAGLYASTVFQILEDDLGFLWMSSNKGISRVARDELLAVADGRLEQVTARAFNRSDGMKANQCNGVSQPAGCTTASGALWFPTVKGVVRVDPANIAINQQPPAVLVQQVLVDGQPLDPGQMSELAAGERNLELHYTALSFVATERIRFRYLLEGFDAAWTDAGTRRTAYYTNIPPGTYRFRVTACNGDGVWSSSGASWAFVVPTPPHRTWWALCLYAAAGVALVLAAVRLRVRALARQNLLLEAKVGQRTAELERSKSEVEQANRILADKIRQLELSEQRSHVSERRAQEANRAKSEFLSTMSHELRTPLNSIIGFASVLFKRLADHPDERTRRFLGNILSSGEHLLHLINDLLDLAKIEAGRMELYLETFDLNAVLTSVDNVMRGVAAERVIAIELVVGGDVPPITGDAVKLKQIMFNLLSNAIKFSPPGASVTVRGERVAAERSPLGVDSVRIDVVDRGIGIREQDRELIFEEFRQADTGAARHYEGSGLGLTLVRRLLDLLGGSVSVESALGKGSTFTVHIPVIRHDPDAALVRSLQP